MKRLILFSLLLFTLTGCSVRSQNTILDGLDAESAMEFAIRLQERMSDYMPVDVSSVQPGLLKGFGSTKITEFTEGYIIAPKASNIPFYAYVFKSEDPHRLQESVFNAATASSLHSVVESDYVLFITYPVNLF